MKELEAKYRELVKTIKEYESDTFSSEAMELTDKEAEKIARAFIIRDIQARIDTDTMDGLMIGEELDEIRGIDE